VRVLELPHQRRNISEVQADSVRSLAGCATALGRVCVNGRVGSDAQRQREYCHNRETQETSSTGAIVAKGLRFTVLIRHPASLLVP